MENLYLKMMKQDGRELEATIERSTIQAGRSFSSEAMDQLFAQLETWVGTRVMRRWNQTNEPPTLLTVRIEVTVA